jgi:hypothetical protein
MGGQEALRFWTEGLRYRSAFAGFGKGIFYRLAWVRKKSL